MTVADIAGTSPKLWNNWKNKLLWDLYLAAGDALRRGLEAEVAEGAFVDVFFDDVDGVGLGASLEDFDGAHFDELVGKAGCLFDDAVVDDIKDEEEII